MTGGPRARAGLDGLPAYRHAARPGGRSVREDYRLASNENPYPPLPSVLAAVAAAAAEADRYPDPACAALAAALAARHGVDPDRLALGTGSVAVARQLLDAVAGPGDEVVFAWRSFESYPIWTQVAGARAVPVPLAPDERHDLPAMAAAVTARTRCVFVCSPNNPTGTAVHADELDAFLDAVPPDVLVVLDEAYVEFVRDPRVPDGLAVAAGRPNVAVLRTFSKAYGLAGLRVGWTAAPPQVAEAARRTSTPFGVSSVAQAAALASLDAEAELLERVDRLVAERDRMAAGLAAQGWAVADGQANFVWLRLGERAEEFAAACAAAGVAVRAFPGDGVRITAAEPEAGDRVLGVAAAFGREG